MTGGAGPDMTPPEPGPASQAPTADSETLALAHRLLDAARDGNSALLAGYLAAGAPVALTTATGDSLLMLASYHGHPDTVRLVLAHGGDPNAANDRGQTPLAGAVFKGYQDVVKALVDGGADPDAGRPSAREAARMFARDDILALLR
jgi:uncharacterized protein